LRRGGRRGPDAVRGGGPMTHAMSDDVKALLPPDKGGTLLVSEIYKCIQGESTFAGVPFVLVRLARCNLRCTWCDSAFSFKGCERWSIATVMADVRSHLLPHVLITGG